MLPKSQFAFRRVLPIVQVIFLFTMVWLATLQDRVFYGQWDAAEEARAERLKQILEAKDRAEGKAYVTWDLRGMLDGFIPPATEILFGVNLPAIPLAIPVALVFFWALPNQWFVYSLSALVVSVFWYLVGREMDRAILRIRVADPSSHLRSLSARRTASILMACGLALGVLLLSTNVRTKALLYGLIFWSAFGILSSFVKACPRMARFLP